VKRPTVSILLHDIRSAHNVGAMFRTADAAGVVKIFLSGTTPRPVDRFGRPVKEIVKTALGAEKTLKWQHVSRVESFLRECKGKGDQIIAIEQDKKALDYKKVSISGPTLFVVGNEVDGLPREILKMCDIVAEIPMLGAKESLNVSVALGIALFRMLDV